MGYLDRELAADEIGDLSLLESSSTAPMSNLPRRPGESLSSWGKRLQAGDAALAAKAKSKTRSGSSASAFNSLHPRGRSGQWTFKQGASGAEVNGIQKRLNAKVDGQFGSLTRAAVIAFQRSHGLQVDGVVGKQTVAAMRGNRKASSVKAGAMSAADRSWLASIH